MPETAQILVKEVEVLFVDFPTPVFSAPAPSLAQLASMKDDVDNREMRLMEVERRDEQTVQQGDILIPGLPFEIAVSCIARVPRSNHLHMSGVSRSWRNLLHGTVLSEVRRELLLAEEWLYLWTQTADAWRYFDPSVEEWFKLPKMPNDDRLSGHSGFGSFDGKLFVIGGYLSSFFSEENSYSYIPCRTVSYFDARSYCWKRTADLNVARAECAVGVINNRLYVFGGYIESSGGGGMKIPTMSTITAEVYDPITNMWNFISSMKFPTSCRDSVVLGGKFYGRGDMGFVYDEKTEKWENMAKGLRSGWTNKTTVLNGKLYGIMLETPEIQNGNALEEDEVFHIKVYDPSNDVWKIVEILDAWNEWDTNFETDEAELVTLGGKLYILFVWSGNDGQGRYSSVLMRVLEVDESTEDFTCLTTSRHDFKIEYELPEQPFWIKRCHVMAL